MSRRVSLTDLQYDKELAVKVWPRTRTNSKKWILKPFIILDDRRKKKTKSASGSWTTSSYSHQLVIKRRYQVSLCLAIARRRPPSPSASRPSQQPKRFSQCPKFLHYFVFNTPIATTPSN